MSPSAPSETAAQLVDRLAEDQRQCWRGGDRVPVEAYLQRYPILLSDPESLFDLIYYEYLLAEEVDGAADLAEFQRRFPQFVQRLQRQLAIARLLDSGSERSHSAPEGVSTKDDSGSAETSRTAAPMFRGTDRFSVLRSLGCGGMGSVYAVSDTQWQQTVALKVLHRTDPAAAFRLKQEFRILSDLSHPNLIQLFELFCDPDQHYFTMELLDGLDLATACQDLPESEVRYSRLRDWLRQLAAGLQTLHDASILHCDVKPSNVLVDRSSRVVLLDFGLALDRTYRADLAGENGAYLRGTVAYVAPEQLRGGAWTPASDWYSVGATLYQALTGRPPFLGSVSEVISAKQRAFPTPPRGFNPDVPDDLDEICLRLLSPAPEERAGGEDILKLSGEAPPASIDLRRALPRDVYVGRGEELARLREELNRAAAGELVGVLVHGRSGAGKTALCDRFLHEARMNGDVLVLSGRCRESESVPFKALDGLIDELSRFLRGLSPADLEELLPTSTAALARMFPVLRRVEAIDDLCQRAELPQDAQRLQKQATDALSELLARLAEHRTIVLFTDDLQWGDADSAEIVTAALHFLRGERLLWLACCRSEDLDASPFLHVLRQQEFWTELESHSLKLGPLSQPEACELATSLLAGHDRGERRRAQNIARLADGNPYLIWLMARMPADPGTLAESLPEGGYERADAILWTRALQLPAESRRLLEVISTAGHPVRIRDAYFASGIETGQRAVSALRAERFIRTATTDGIQHVEPYHDRIRESIVGHLSESTRRSHHLQLALALESHSEPDASQLAQHCFAAGKTERAGEYARRAAEQAVSKLAFEEAIHFYQLAIETSQAESQEDSALQCGLADALASAGRSRESAEAYLVAQAQLSGPESRRLRRLAAQQYIKSGHIREGYALLHPLLEEVGLRLPKTPLRGLLMGLGLDLVLRLRGLGFQERPAEQIPQAQLEQLELCWITALAASVHDFRQGMAVQKLHLLRSLRTGEPRQIGLGLTFEAYFLAGCGPRAARRARRLLDQADALGLRLGDAYVQLFPLLIRGLEAVMQGRWRESPGACQKAMAILQDSPVRYWYETDVGEHCLSIAQFYLGEFAALAERVPALLDEALRRGDRFGVHWFRMGYCNAAWLATDQPLRARRELDSAIREFPPERYSLDHFLQETSELHLRLYLGEGRDAWERVQHAWNRVKSSGTMLMPFFRTQMLLFHGTCALSYAVCGGPKWPLLRQAERDASRLERIQLEWAKPAAQLLRAQVAVAHGEIAPAERLFREAAAGFTRLDMAMHAAACRQRLGELLGGTEGEWLTRLAEDVLSQQAIRNPAVLLRLYAPDLIR